MTWIDYVLLAIVGISAFFGVLRGFVKELLSLLIWVLSIWVALRFSNTVSVILSPYITHEGLRLVVAFIVLMIAVLILGTIVSRLLQHGVQKLGLKGNDRTLGIVFGLARGVLLSGLLAMIFALSPIAQTTDWQHAVVLPYLKVGMGYMAAFAPKSLAGYFSLP